VTDMKEQVAESVRQIDEVNRNIADHWSMVQRYVAEKRLDEAISVLNAYFRLKTKLNQVESALEGKLHGYFSDK
jgi:hypothetical protein